VKATHEQKEPKKDLNVRTAQLVQLLTEVGPDIPEIARRLGQFKESVRYRYKEKILGRGFAVQAMVDHERLGLKRFVIVADFAEDFRPYAQPIMVAMNELCYVGGYAKTIPDGLFVMNASVPGVYAAYFSDFMSRLKEKGMFNSVKVFEFDWFRNLPMRGEFYDFNTGRWDFDWNNAAAGSYDAASYQPSASGRFDQVDLLILKELQMDANKSLIDIANKLKINYKKLAWHYVTHVIQNQLIKGYRINWMGTRYDYKIERALQRQHRYLWLDLIATRLTDVERMQLMARITKLPFLWADAGGGSYFAELAVPVDSITEALQYLEEAIAPIRNKTEYHIMDQTNALAFTLSYQLYDADKKAWKFNEPELISRFENLILKIREGGG
jgi:hypothetical protein